MLTERPQSGRTWFRSLAFLAAGLAAAYQAVRIFYILPWFGGATTLDRWLGRYSCVVPPLCGPQRLHLDHAGAALTILSAVFFGLAFYRHPSVFSAQPVAAEVEWSSRPRHTRLACTLFALMGLEAVLYQSFSVGVQGRAPYVVVWLAGIGGVLAAGLLWDRVDRLDWSFTLSGLVTATGVALTILGAAAVLVGSYPGAWIAVVGLLLAWLGVRLQPRPSTMKQWIDISLALAMPVGYLVLVLSRATAWQIADVGDEWGFYNVAHRILENPGELRAPFASHDPDGYHTLLSSGMQAAVMGITRSDVVGWRLSSVLPVAWAMPALYLFARWLGGRSLSWFSGLLLVGAHVLLTFALVPYNNTQALMALGLALGALAWAMDSPGVLRLLITGMFIGMGILLHSLAYLVVLPIFMLLSIQLLPNWRRIGVSLLLVTAGAVAVASPLLADPDHWYALMKATPAQTEVSQIYSLHVQITRNIVSGVFDFLIDPTYRMSHFVVGGRVDPLTGVLVLMGGAATVVDARRSRTATAWLLAAITLLVSASGVQQYGWFAITRSFILVPVYAIFAGLGGLALTQVIAPHSRRLQSGILLLLAVTALALNHYHVDRLSLPRSADSRSPAAYVVRELQAAAALGTPGHVTVVLAEPEHSILPTVADAYGLGAYLSLAKTDDLVTGKMGCPVSTAPVALTPASTRPMYGVRRALDKCWQDVTVETLDWPDGTPMLYRFTPE